VTPTTKQIAQLSDIRPYLDVGPFCLRQAVFPFINVVAMNVQKQHA